jgi:hypothetical protein
MNASTFHCSGSATTARENREHRIFFCPYTGREIVETDSSVEHVLPESLGGLGGLTVRVDREANNRLGSEVDAKVTPIFALERVEYDLRGHSGSPPKFEVKVKIPALGHRQGLWEITKSGSVLRPKALVQKTKGPEGRVHVEITGEATQARAIAHGMREKLEKNGQKFEFVDRTEQQLEKPVIEGTFEYDPVAFGRFYAKVALGLGHWIWGDSWSRGPHAAKFRVALWGSTEEELNSAGLDCATMESPAALDLRIAKYEHAFVWAAAPGGGYALAVFLFGGSGWLFKVGAPDRPPPAPQTDVVILDVQAGTLQRMTYAELVREGRHLRFPVPPP